ncbi:unnamed protein product [Mycena citricolor]|uniref:Signal recognition particle subunit SRP14 n=1 Tax=Mycena citricolor TaxID=2018698 RepID=A0AAD2HU28_9AGAR|nr:unnamed protein product [Mycena citricolor]
MESLSHDSFLQRLSELFDSSQEHGSIWITHKRLRHDGENATMAEGSTAEDDSQEYPCLLRVTDGTIKFSTRVQSTELDKFHAAYGALLKSSMSSLRKRDKKKEKLRAEMQAKIKKKLEEPLVVDGPKRGKGRSKRKRQEKAKAKQQVALQKAKERDEARSKSAAQAV